MGIATVIRPAKADEIDCVVRIENDAAVAFREFGYTPTVELDPQPRELYELAHDDGKLLVAVTPDDVVGFAAYSEVDQGAHLDEIGVVRRLQGSGIGTRLLARVIADAKDLGYRSMTLTTFCDLPFNAPWYSNHGFVALQDDELQPELAGHRAHEKAMGLDAMPRCAMRLLLV